MAENKKFSVRTDGTGQNVFVSDVFLLSVPEEDRPKALSINDDGRVVLTTVSGSGGGGTVDTGSLLNNASVSLNTITFQRGDSTTFDITVDTGSAATVNTGSLLQTASVSLNTITFTKGDTSTFDITVDTGSDTVTSYTNATNNRVITSTGAGGINGEANLTFNGSTLTVTGGITATIGTGTDNSVVVKNSSNQLVTDEIDPKVWAGNLVDKQGTPVQYQVATFNDSDTLVGSSNLTFDNSTLSVTGNVTATSFTGSLSGSATTATNATSASYAATASLLEGTIDSASFAETASLANNIKITANTSTDTTTYPVLVGANTATGQAAFIDNANLSYNASTNTLTATTFNGNLTGNALTANGALSSSHADNSSTSETASLAINANSSSITDEDGVEDSYYVTFVDNTSGYNNLKVDSSTLTYNPGSNTLTADIFVGSLSGNASTATTSTNATSASYAATASLLEGTIDSASFASTASYVEYANIANKPSLISSSAQLDGFISKSANFTTNELIVADGINSVVSSNILSLDTVNNYVGINQSNPEVTLHMTGEGAQTAQIRMEQYNDSADAPDLRTRRYRGTIALSSSIQAGDYLYRSNHEYWNGSALIVGGSFAFDNTNDANRTQFAVSVTTDGTSADPADASKTQFKIDGNDGGAITFNNAYKFPTSDGSANQILQTNGAGALSFTGSPTFTGLTVDTNTLYVDAANNRIGIGTTSPAYQVEIENTGANALLVLDRTDGVSTFIEGGATASVLGSVGANDVKIAYNSFPVVTIGASGAITVNPDGDGFTFPTTDGTNGQSLITNGSGVLSFGTVPTSSFALTSDSASKITIDPVTSTDTTAYPVLVGNNSVGAQSPFIDNTNLSYNASTNTLTTTTFSGALSGNALTATTASYANKLNPSAWYKEVGTTITNNKDTTNTPPGFLYPMDSSTGTITFTLNAGGASLLGGEEWDFFVLDLTNQIDFTVTGGESVISENGLKANSTGSAITAKFLGSIGGTNTWALVGSLQP